jgi:taurine--2-oxoglutarate transaminase
VTELSAPPRVTSTVAGCLEASLYEWVPQAGYQPMEIVRAEGCAFYTAAGERILDLASQLVVTNLGHSIEPVHAAVYEQSRTLGYVSPAHASAPRAQAARKLAAVTPDHITKFFFSTSGTEANNDAIRIARSVTGRGYVLYSSRSYHGAHGPAAMASGDDRRRLMEQDPTACVPFRAHSGHLHDDLVAFHAAVEAIGPQRVAAVIVEAVPGGGGVRVPRDGYLQAVEETCRRHGIQLICDEVLTGFGRTGEWFAFQHWGLRPDLMTVGKALSAGAAPIAAVGVSEGIAARLDEAPLGCGHTFSAHPLSCAAASAALDLYQRTGAVARAARTGAVLAERLRATVAAAPGVRQVRAIGMLAAVEVADAAEAGRVQRSALRRGAYLLAKGPNLIVAPPLLIDVPELEEGLHALGQALAEQP